MAHKDFEEDDPLELIGVELSGVFPTESDCMEEMARTFIDEYARIGWNREQLLKLFQDPFYQGPHRIYQTKGEAFVQRLISERIPARLVGHGAEGPEDHPLCNACPVGRSFGKTECPIRRRTHHLVDWLKARFLRRSLHV